MGATFRHVAESVNIGVVRILVSGSGVFELEEIGKPFEATDSAISVEKLEVPPLSIKALSSSDRSAEDVCEVGD